MRNKKILTVIVILATILLLSIFVAAIPAIVTTIGEPPVVTNPTANPSSIPADGTTVSRLNVTVTDDTAVDTVKVDLTQIGGPEKTMMSLIGDNLCSDAPIAVVGTSPGTYFLPVNATDIDGNSNSAVSIQLQVVSPMAKVSIPNATASPEATVTVPINITGVTDLATAEIWLSYNKDVVVVDSVSDGNIGSLTSSMDNITGVTKMNWFSTTGKTGNFVFAYVILNATGSTDQTSALNLTVLELTDPIGDPIDHTVEDGLFTVCAQPQLMEGDVSMNMHVTMVDAMFIAQYKAGIRSLNESQLKCADTTDEGTVSMLDAMLIAQWRAGIPFKPLWESPADDDMLPPAE